MNLHKNIKEIRKVGGGGGGVIAFAGEGGGGSRGLVLFELNRSHVMYFVIIYSLLCSDTGPHQREDTTTK